HVTGVQTCALPIWHRQEVVRERSDLVIHDHAVMTKAGERLAPRPRVARRPRVLRQPAGRARAPSAPSDAPPELSLSVSSWATAAAVPATPIAAPVSASCTGQPPAGACATPRHHGREGTAPEAGSKGSPGRGDR